MKRRNAILLGVAFVMLIVGYVAWCWRPFYLRPLFRYHDNVPPDAVAVIEDWRRNSPDWEPSEFEIRHALKRLGQPWEARYSFKVNVLFFSEENAIGIGDPFECVMPYHFVKEDGRWKGYDLNHNPLEYD